MSPQCSYCAQVVQQFWQMIKNCITNFYPNFILNRKEAIFGHVSSNGDSIINTILALARYYIYQQKFTSRELDEVRFLIYMKDHLGIIYQLKKSKNLEATFLQEWHDILIHFQVLE